MHPKATIFAIAGPIVIGSGCIIEEGAIVVNRRKEVMRIGDDNLFEICCRMFSDSFIIVLNSIPYRRGMPIYWRLQYYLDAFQSPSHNSHVLVLRHRCRMPSRAY